ncbi:MAG: cytochrome c [Halopseudomonas sp.]
MHNISRSPLVIGTAVMLACAVSTQSWAEGLKPDTAARMRQGFMQTQKFQVAHIAAVSKGKVEFTDETVQRAQNLANLAQIIPDMFAVRSDTEMVEGANALPKAWDDAKGRNKIISRLQQETARLAEVAQQRDVKALGAQFKRVGKVCKSCHDDYKKPKAKK